MLPGMGRGIFVREDGQLRELTEQGFPSEDELQLLLEQHPSLIPGDGIGSSPRRWVCVAREVDVADSPDGSARWKLDHLYLDQDGVPTLIEVKRSSDTRIRREVVGQMLDYAANAAAYWRADEIRSLFESQGVDQANVRLREDLGIDEPEDFWERVRANFASRRLRLVFVADAIPPELRRIVEYLNEQMTETEVLAVEIRQYRDRQGTIQTLVPTLIGQTEVARAAKATRQRRTWDEESILREIREQRGADEHAVAARFFAWAKERLLVFQFGTGATIASFQPGLKDSRGYIFPVYLYSSGTFEIEFQTMESAPYYPFDSEAQRQELRRRLNAVPGIHVPESRVRPNLALSLFHDQTVLDKFLAVIDWTLEEAEAWRRTNTPPAAWSGFASLAPPRPD